MRELKDADTYFNCVLEKALLGHRVDNCDVLEKTNDVDIRPYIPLWWGEYHGVQ